MKQIIFAVFEAGCSIDELLHQLHAKGYNGTFLAASSFNTLVNSIGEEEPSVLSLTNALRGQVRENPTFFSIINEEDFPIVSKIIEDFTGDFKKIRGAVFAWPVTFFKGSF
ncbi:MAG: hypothetical protein LKJ88_03405 [Bacilli bacterium]|jgi:hypothetical protein|nr:hypothetical protein [Bacilli bacterium]